MDKFDKCAHSRSKPSGEFWDEYCKVFNKSKELVNCKDCPHFTSDKDVAQMDLDGISRQMDDIKAELKEHPATRTDLEQIKKIMDAMDVSFETMRRHLDNLIESLKAQKKDGGDT